MYKKISLFLISLLMLISFSSCGNTVSSNNNKIKVVVSFNAIREFAEAVGKDKVDVITMIPNGTEPHEFEPKIKDFQSLSDAKVFIYSGMNMEKWATKAVEAANNSSLIAVDASKGYKPLKSSSEEENSEYDPHVWISLKGAEYEAKNIRDGLIKADPNNKSYYEKNYSDFYDKLEALYKEYNDKFSALSNKNFVTGHAAFAYFCKDFSLKQNSVEDVFAEGEPSSKQMESLIDYCKSEHIKTIFVEDMVSPKVSETLAKAVGAKAVKIYTNESKEDNLDYISSTKKNLENIYDSLK